MVRGHERRLWIFLFGCSLIFTAWLPFLFFDSLVATVTAIVCVLVGSGCLVLDFRLADRQFLREMASGPLHELHQFGLTEHQCHSLFLARFSRRGGGPMSEAYQMWFDVMAAHCATHSLDPGSADVEHAIRLGRAYLTTPPSL